MMTIEEENPDEGASGPELLMHNPNVSSDALIAAIEKPSADSTAEVESTIGSSPPVTPNKTGAKAGGVSVLMSEFAGDERAKKMGGTPPAKSSVLRVWVCGGS